METLNIYKWNILALGGFLTASLAGLTAQYTAHNVVLELPKLEIDVQKVQAKELLAHAPKSLEQQAIDIERSGKEFIYNTVETSLPAAYRPQAAKIAHALIEEANRYDLDPIFLLAVIKTESGFNPLARGNHGDKGLMQLLQKTADWIGKRKKMPTPVNLYDPVTNIRIGAAYLAQLRKHFGRIGSRYLAAYNMGTRNVHKLLRKDVEPTLYAGRVLKNYRGLYLEWTASLPKPARTLALNN